MLFIYVYDRYGNRWQQNITQGSGPQPQLSFNASNNQVVGYQYDAVGNVLNDGVHSYSYDGENNLIGIDNGATATFVYDALNERVKVSTSAGAQDYGYDLSGRRSTVWVPGSTSMNAVQYYAGSNRVAYWTASDGNIHFEHQDWLGTERMRTSATASVDGSYSSLPFGDNLQVSGNDTNPGHFAMLDQDVSASSGLSHAMFREYSETAGRWMSPDPYLGSYSQHNPQSFNRYAYVLNNPLGFTDLLGLSSIDCVTITTQTDAITSTILYGQVADNINPSHTASDYTTATNCVFYGSDSNGTSSKGNDSGGSATSSSNAPNKPKPTKPCVNVFNFGGLEADAGPVSIFSGTVTDMNPGDAGALYELSLGEGVNFGVAITRSFVTGKWDYFLFGGAKAGGPVAGVQTGFIVKPGNILSGPDMFGAYVEGHEGPLAAGFGADVQNCHT